MAEPSVHDKYQSDNIKPNMLDGTKSIRKIWSNSVIYLIIKSFATETFCDEAEDLSENYNNFAHPLTTHYQIILNSTKMFTDIFNKQWNVVSNMCAVTENKN